MITADIHKIKTSIEEQERREKVIAGKTKVNGQQFTVVVQGVRTNRIETPNQERDLAKLQGQNSQLKD